MFLVSAAVLRWLVRRLARRPGWTVIDKQTGQEVTLRERHTMFFVPLRYWAIAYAVAGVALAIVGLLPR